MSDKLFYYFDDYRLDAHTRVLYRGNDVVRLEPKIVDMLLMLVQGQGMVVSKEDLMKKIWSDTIVEESAIRRNISLLRSALDSTNIDRYIETLPRQGYRFRVPVTQRMISLKPAAGNVAAKMSEPKTSSTAASGLTTSEYPVVAITRLSRLLWTYRWLGVALVVLFAGLGYRYMMQSKTAQATFNIKQVTTNSEELPIIAGAISPEGSMIAFADTGTLFVSDTTTIERHALTLPNGVVPSNIEWFNDSIHLLVSSIDPVTHESTLWNVPVLGGKAELLVRNGRMATLSADAQHIVFVRNQNQLWIANSDGSSPTLFATASGASGFGLRPQFSQDGLYVLYSLFSEDSTESRIEARNIRTGKVTLLYDSQQRIPDFSLINNNELLFTQQKSRGSEASQLLSMTVNIASGFHSVAQVLVTSTEELQGEFNATSNGKTLLMIRSRSFSTVQIGDLSKKGTVLSNVRRLTLDDSQNLPSAWMPDGSSVLFFSNRTGHFGIFQQSISSPDARALVSDEHDYIRPVVSADQQWLFYFMPEDAGKLSPNLRISMIRQAMNGSRSQVIDTHPDFYRSLRCASRVNKCVLVEHDDQFAVFYDFDPQQGKGAELVRVNWVPEITAFYWDLSNDASRIAYLDAAKGPNDIAIINVEKHPATTTRIHVPDYDPLATLYWDAYGKGFYISSYNSSGDLMKLLHVNLDGSTTVLRQQRSTRLSWAIPSPDGNYLMFHKVARKSNLWLLRR